MAVYPEKIGFGKDDGMSLRFVLGSSGSGKSMRIYSEILIRAKKEPERNFLIVVPDQFTMQTQKELIVHPDN